MKNKKNVIALLWVALVIVIIYTFIAFRVTRPEIQFLTKWTFTLDEKTLPSTESELVSFRLGNTLGYFSPAGNFSYKYEIPVLKNGKLAKSSISSDFFAICNEDSSFSVKNPDGSNLVKISDIGNPFISEDRLYLFTPGGASFLRYDLSGKELFRSEGYVPIISFASSIAGTVVGYADGEVRCLSDSGDELFSLYPGGSSYPVILGVDIANSGEYVACVSGIDSQRFVLIRRNGNQQKIVFHEYLDGNIKENVNVYFTEDSNFVYYNFENSLGIVDCKKLVSKHISIEGKVLKIAEIPSVDAVFVLSKLGNDCTVTIIEGSSNVLGTYEYQAESTFISAKDDKLFIGADDKISCIQVVKN